MLKFLGRIVGLKHTYKVQKVVVVGLCVTTHRESRKLKAAVKAVCGEDRTGRFVKTKKKTNAEEEGGGDEKDPLFLSVCFFRCPSLNQTS